MSQVKDLAKPSFTVPAVRRTKRTLPSFVALKLTLSPSIACPSVEGREEGRVVHLKLE